MGVWSSNKLQRLDYLIRYQDSRPNNGCLMTCPFCGSTSGSHREATDRSHEHLLHKSLSCLWMLCLDWIECHQKCFFKIYQIWQAILPEASFGLRVLSSPASVCVSVCVCVNHLLVRAITWDPFKLESPNFDQRCKRPWLRSLLFWGAIDLDHQGQI